MADDDNKDLAREAPSHCPTCDGVPRLYLALPDRSKRTKVYLYRCSQCGALIWVD
jgi:hypothetical protein